MATALFPDLVVNGEVLPQARIAAEAQNHEAPKGKPGVAWRKAAQALAIRTLMLQEAARRGLVADPAEIGPGRFETEEEALIRGLLDAAITVAPPEEAAIDAEWRKDPSRFRTPPLWEVSHILVACDPRDGAARESARSRATGLTSLALETPDSFAKLARHNSDCGSRSNGGALGQLGPGDTVPEFEATLRRLAEAEITPEPVLTRHGYHIIRMDALGPRRVLPYSAVRQKISDAMEKAAWTEAARGFVTKLVESARITGTDMRPV